MTAAFPPDRLVLGVGALAMGRAWGVANVAAPSEKDANALLETAISEGITIFDTAPAYAASERRLGAFLGKLPASQRNTLHVLTKIGEHWNDDTGAPYVDHSRDAMIRSIDRSLALLGTVTVLQLHKATEDVLTHPDTLAALDHAARCGIRHFGASVSGVAAGELAIASGRYTMLQFPLNPAQRQMEPLLEALARSGGTAIINRPFAMGGLVHDAADKQAAAVEAYAFLKARLKTGIVLTGTGKAAHLRENVAAFGLAV